MKISTQRILMTTLAGAGLFAVLLAYRSSPPNVPTTYEADLSISGVSGSMSGKNLVGVSVEPTVIESKDSITSNDLPTIDSPQFESEKIDLGDALPVVADPGPAEAASFNAVVESPVDTSVVDAADESELATSLKGSKWKANPSYDPSNSRSRVPNATKIASEDNGSGGFVLNADVGGENGAKVGQFQQSVKPAAATSPVPAPQPPRATGLSEAAAQKAVHHIEYGKSLARRNATEAAGQEFISALRILAESYDAHLGGNEYTRALRNGLLAIREAADFKSGDAHSEVVMNIEAVSEGHESQVLSIEEKRSITASAATRRYMAYAGQQLGFCGGPNVVAAEALYCLGKMRSIAAKGNADPESLEMTQAIIYHHASLTADPGNYRSANELGVLLAQNGQLPEAEAFLKASLKIKQAPQSWANLAKVHQRKGTAQDAQLANLAMNEYQNSLMAESTGALPGPIQWVSPQEFIARSPVEYPDGTITNAPVRQGAVVPASNVAPVEEKRSVVSRIGDLVIPKSFRR